MAYPWIKLYTEIIHDPKVGRLSEHLQLLFVKLLCVAGEHDGEREGWLPPLEEVAWTLRMDDDTLAADIKELQRARLVTEEGGAWRVTNFAERQGPMQPAERMRALRQRQQREAYYDDGALRSCDDHVTNRNTDIDRDVDIDTDVDIEVVLDSDAPPPPPPAPAASAPATADAVKRDALTALFYERLARLGVMPTSQAQAEAYNDVIARVRGHPQPEAFMAQLFEEAAATTNGRVTPRWFEAVTDRCLREGRMPGDRPPQGQRARAPAQTTETDWSAIAAQIAANGGVP